MDREFTSPRLRKSLQPAEVERREQEKDTGRNVREMPILGTEMDHVVTRTTNFSTLDRNNEKEMGKGLTEEQLFEIICGEKSLEDFLNTSGNNKKESDEKLALMKCSRNYLEIPVVLKDLKTNDYFGVISQSIKEQEFTHPSLEVATGVRLVMSQRVDSNQQDMPKN